MFSLEEEKNIYIFIIQMKKKHSIEKKALCLIFWLKGGLFFLQKGFSPVTQHDQ